MSLLKKITTIVDKPVKRVGRGVGSGKGEHTAGRGNKGMRARKSGETPLWFEGGQLQLGKRLPMLRGKARFEVLEPTAEVSLTALENMKADVITLDTLKLEKVIDKKFKKAKVVANGAVKRKVTLKGVHASATAAKHIEKAGGSIEA